MRDIFISFNEFPDTQLIIVPQLIHVLKVDHLIHLSAKQLYPSLRLADLNLKWNFFFNNHENWLAFQ